MSERFALGLPGSDGLVNGLDGEPYQAPRLAGCSRQGVDGMMMKLLMSWDIKTGREQPYFEFIVREFAPKLMRLGLQPTEAWYTVYGEGPQILTGGVASDSAAMDRILESDEWRALRSQLLNYVTNFSQKVVPASGSFQL
jgi:hypothetical protein